MHLDFQVNIRSTDYFGNFLLVNCCVWHDLKRTLCDPEELRGHYEYLEIFLLFHMILITWERFGWLTRQ